mmetsp:Transcript_30497/g.86023  ORF Transcript_30497/g.86023 Transcript_30497/m.86023 type:complete len:200 (-) Transcript_30497:71-670(-)
MEPTMLCSGTHAAFTILGSVGRTYSSRGSKSQVPRGNLTRTPAQVKDTTSPRAPPGTSALEWTQPTLSPTLHPNLEGTRTLHIAPGAKFRHGLPGKHTVARSAVNPLTVPSSSGGGVPEDPRLRDTMSPVWKPNLCWWARYSSLTSNTRFTPGKLTLVQPLRGSLSNPYTSPVDPAGTSGLERTHPTVSPTWKVVVSRT